MNYRRNKVVYIFYVLIVITCGLASRWKADIIPDFLDLYLGDALWALMIFLLFGLLFPAYSSRNIGILSYIFCILIELSQLYHASWIDAMRATTIGGLVLGYGFLWSDLLAYSIGVAVGFIFEYIFYKKVGRA